MMQNQHHHGRQLGTFVETDPTGRYARFDQVLGKGAVKTVYKAVDEMLGIEVAWNQCHLNHLLSSEEELQRLYSEVHLLSTLNHDSIIQFYTSWIDTHCNTFNFITEMFTSGTLREYRKMFRRIDVHAIKSWARQVLRGLVYLHGHDPPVIHRDLKCDNIFVNGHLGQAKIGDLGLAAILRGRHSAHSIIGTPEFMAPELYEEDYNELVDVYSFGMCVLEMFTGEYPYSECANPAQIYKKVTAGKLPRAFYQIKDTEAQRFVGKCLRTASKRLSAKELMMDPFLSTAGELSMAKKIGTQKPFLNDLQLEKLKLGDKPGRTKMTITGKLNREDDTIFLKVQISNENDSARNIYFPFDVLSDTPIDVANEMVKDLEITDWDPQEIANMIDEEISILVPDWKKWEGSRTEHQHGQHYQLSGNDIGPVRPLLSSSCSSSQASAAASELPTSQGTDDFHDDTSSMYSERSCDPDPSRTSQGCHPRHANTGNLSKLSPVTHLSKTSRTGQRKLARHSSVVDLRSQELHGSLVAEVGRRRLVRTVGEVEDIGFKSPYA